MAFVQRVNRARKGSVKIAVQVELGVPACAELAVAIFFEHGWGEINPKLFSIAGVNAEIVAVKATVPPFAVDALWAFPSNDRPALLALGISNQYFSFTQKQLRLF